jgi:hypothetical protein
MTNVETEPPEAIRRLVELGLSKRPAKHEK